MKLTKLKAFLCFILCLVLIIPFGVGCSAEKEEPVTTEITTIEETSVAEPAEEVIISAETKELVSDTIEDIENGEDIATNEVIESSAEEEATVFDEGAVEPDAQVEQENIAYEGSNSGDGLNLLGAYQGLTYYNQADSRWANKLYTSTGNRTQTMASSACGPTAAAMVVSSSKGAILPTTMAQLFVDNRYRTANNGTAWAAFPFVADYFGFKEYYKTTSFSTMTKYLKKGYFVIASCNSGLWTTGGHYIVLVADNGGTITVYDPYLYNGKFNTASRRAANVRVSGNAAYVSETNFKKYSNAIQYWIFSNDHSSNSSNSSSSSSSNAGTAVNYTRYVATQSAPLNIRSGPGTNYNIVGSLSKGTKVTVMATSGKWSRIGTNRWVSSEYLSASRINSSTSSSSSYKTKVGNTYKLKSNTTLYSRSNLSGTKYSYKANTTIRVLSHVSTTIDYIYVVYTGRYAYCPVSAFTSTSASSTSNSTVGKYYRLKTNTTLYSNSNLTGTRYQYLPLTQVKVLRNISNSVDYIQVVKTGRKAYVRVSAYR